MGEDLGVNTGKCLSQNIVREKERGKRDGNGSSGSFGKFVGNKKNNKWIQTAAYKFSRGNELQ